MKKIQLPLFKIFLSLLLIIGLQEVSAQSCSINTNVNGIGGVANVSTNIGQSFTACGNGKLSTVSVGVVNTGSPTAIVRIYAGEGTNGTLLGQGAAVALASNRTNLWDLNSLNINLISGQKYTAYFLPTGVGGYPTFQYGTYPVDYYSGGRVIDYGAANNDMFFSATITGLSTSLMPLHQATIVSRKSPLKIQFSKAMIAYTGNISIKNTSTATIISVPVADLVIDGSLVTIPYDDILEPNTVYEVLIPNTALKSTDAINFVGYTTGQWIFTTTDQVLPQLATTLGTITNQSPVPFTVDFTEAVTGFDISDLTITNGSASAFSGTGTAYAFDITPTGEGEVKVKILADVTAEGNEVDSLSIEYDITNPTVAITSTSSISTNRALITVDIEFSDPLSGFESTDLNIINAEVVDFDMVDDSHYSVSLYASAEGLISITIPTSAAMDAAGNDSDASNTFEIEYTIDLKDGLLSYYPFNNIKWDVNDKNGELSDYGTAPNSVSDHHGQAGGAYDFTVGIFELSGYNNSPVEKGYAFSTWINPNTELGTFSNKRVIYDHKGSTSSFYYQTGELHFVINTANEHYTFATILAANTWHHLAVSITEGGKVVFYVNGVANESGDFMTTVETRSNFLYIGGTDPANNTATSFLNGAIDELRFYGKPLHPSEVSALQSLPEVLLVDSAATICGNEPFVTPDGTELSVQGSYYFIDPSGDSSPDTFVSLTLTVNQPPVVSGSALSTSVCEGEELILSGNGASTYIWDNGVEDGVAFTANSTNTYEVSGTDLNGCTNTGEITITVTPRTVPNAGVTASNPSFCPDDNTGSLVTIASSEVGINYYLRNSLDNSIVDGPKEGTGNTLDFSTGALSATTTYNVYGEPIEGSSADYVLDMDGVDDRLTTNYAHGALSQFTFEALIFPKSTNVDRIISNYLGGGNVLAGDIILDTYDATANNGRALRIYIGGASSAILAYSVPNVLTLNTWNHVAATFDNNAVKLYVNGIEVGSTTASFASIPASVNNFGLGEDITPGASENFYGQMDEIRIWDVARTANEILDHKSLCLVGNEAGLQAYWNFNDASGTTATDLVNGKIGTLTNMDANTDWVTSGSGLTCALKCGYQMDTEVTIGDVESPTVVAQDISVDIDLNTGLATITPEMIDNGSADNCSFTMSLSKTQFGCDETGEQTVTLTVTDPSGNMASVEATVTVNSPFVDETVSLSSASTCANGSSTTVTTNSSVADMYYYLRNSSDNSIVDGPIIGDGNDLSFNTGTVNETTTFNVFSALPPSESIALDFDGGDDYVGLDVDQSIEYNTTFTTEGWFNIPTSTSTFFSTFFSIGTTAVSDLEVYFQRNSRVMNVVFNRGGTVGYNSYPAIPADQWFHLAIVHSGTSTVVYYNGVVQNPTTLGGLSTMAKTANSKFIVGDIRNAALNANQMNLFGQADEIRFWSVARSAAELMNNKSQCISGESVGLEYYFNFDEGEGTTTTNLTGLANGTLTNMDAATDWVSGAAITCVNTCGLQMSNEVTVGDEIDPDLMIQDISVQLNANGLANISSGDLITSVSDNCTANNALVIELDKTSFDCTEVGDHSVNITVTDESGNQASAVATVTVTSFFIEEVLSTSVTVQCPNTAFDLTTNSSQQGVKYTLRDETNTLVDGPVVGTGSGLTFNTGVVNQETTYYLHVENPDVNNHAMQLAGAAGAYVSIPSSPSLQLSDNWTIEAWVNPGASGGIVNIVETYNQDGGFVLRLSSGQVQAYAFYSNASENHLFTTDAIPLTQWSHVAATFNESTDVLSIYINGVLNLSNTNAIVDQRGSTTTIKLGARGDDTQINGLQYQDEVRIWNVARSAQQIADNMSTSLLGNQSGLVAYYDYNDLNFQPSGMIITDKSGNGNNGTVLGNYSQANILAGANVSSPINCGTDFTSTITISPSDTESPTAIAQNIVIGLQGNSTVSITASDIDNGSFDNCGGVTLSLDNSTFGVADLGENTVTLTVEDAGGNVSTATAVVTILDKFNQTITFNVLDDKTYGDASFELTATASSELAVTYQVISGPVSISDNVLTILGAGEAIIEASQAGDDNYVTATPVQQSLTISQATLSVMANSISIAYQGIVPELTYAFEGFVNADDQSVLNELPLIGEIGSANAGTYSIVLSGGLDDNYLFNLINGTLTINQASLIVTADNKTIVYGESVPELTFTYSGFVNGEGAESLTSVPVLTYSMQSNVFAIVVIVENSDIPNAGIYDIVVSGGSAINYQVTKVDAILTVNKADQTISVGEMANVFTNSDESIIINASVSSGLSLTYDVSGPAVANGNTVSLTGGSGLVTITVSQVGDTNYNPAASQQITFNVFESCGSLSVEFAEISNISCSGMSDGFINIQVTGGNEPYSFAWNNESITKNIAGLNAGTYNVTVADAAGCQVSPEGVAITDPFAINITASADGNTINVASTGGTGAHGYSINGDTFNAQPSFSGLNNGTYTVTVRDENGCMASTSVTVDFVTGIGSEVNMAFYPNPVSDYLVLKNVASLTLFDLFGREVLNVSDSRQTVDLRSIPTGVYVMIAKSNDGQIIKEKLVKRVK